MTPEPTPNREQIIEWLSQTGGQAAEALRAKAESLLFETCGRGVALRGLIEISNACACDCLYCGIRKSNRDVARYTLEEDQIVAMAKDCAARGYGSLVLQSGERRDRSFLDLVENTVRRIKAETQSEFLPRGLGITLSLGEQTEETYARFFEAGAHRYLLRIETSNPVLFAKIHPQGQKIETRLEALRSLRRVGYQVGTGVMIGLPDQTIEDLADDILFFKEWDIDMIGMGPFIPHQSTPMAGTLIPNAKERLDLALRMIAVARLVLRDINIAATTALQALDPFGREKALTYGANVMMPLMTPVSVRKDYQLYPGKPFSDEAAESVEKALERALTDQGRHLVLNVWGDSPHACARKNR